MIFHYSPIYGKFYKANETNTDFGQGNGSLAILLANRRQLQPLVSTASQLALAMLLLNRRKKMEKRK
jgi:hypothetical protein